MNGIMILNEMSVRGEDLCTVIAWVLLGVLCIALKIYDIVEDWQYDSLCSRIVSIILTLAISLGFIAVGARLYSSYSTFHTEYQVAIDDSVGFNEFNSRYEIISQDGDIYTVRDKIDLE